ncbi:MAG: lysophospholipid acyltransferase family protein [Chloroflexi bacterium]|nr:lysophospholipid acyltransferase family protein [Chloroflexota bacterium]MDA1240720.1 lysophospholipid acyltransferase family protein [Chloroflexota bacterium]
MIRFTWLWFLAHVAGRLPSVLLDVIAAAAGTVAWYASRRVRETTTDHMRHVLGVGAPPARVAAAARECARSAARYYAAFALAGTGRSEPLSKAVEAFEGLPVLREAYERGQGVVLVSAHLGNAELVGRAVVPLGFNLAAVTELLSPPRVHDLVHRVRGREGVRLIPTSFGGMRDAMAHLRAGGTLGLLVDRDVLGTAPLRPFFGERAPLPTGAVELARRTGAPMFAVWIPRTAGGRSRVIIEPVPLPPATGDREVDVETGMAALTAALEGGIRRWPGQWFALVPIWGERER